MRDTKRDIFAKTVETAPVIESFFDKGAVSSFFKAFPFVPFAGSTQKSGHTLLRFLQAMRSNSPTHGSCIENLLVYCLGGKIKVTKNKNKVFDIEEDIEPSIEAKKSFVEFIDTISFNVKTIKDLAESILDDYKSTGNAFYSVVITSTLSQYSYAIHHYSPDKVLYKITEPNQPKILAVCKDWNKYLYFSANQKKELEYKEIPLFPNYAIDEFGSIVTMFHVKDERKEWYGLPDSFQAYQSMYSEYSIFNYLNKKSDKSFSGQVLFEYEDVPNPIDDGTDDIEYKQEIAKTYSNEGNGESILVLKRPYGSQEIFVHEFAQKLDSTYFKDILEIAENKIIQANQLTQRLIGNGVSKGLSNNAAVDDLKMRLPMFSAYQNMIEESINKALSIIIKTIGRTDLEGLGIEFTNPFQELLDSLKDAGVQQNNIISQQNGSDGLNNG